MKFLKGSFIFLMFYFLGIVMGSAERSGRIFGRLHVPSLGIGPTCTGCPSHYCDDDPAIIEGYCCGCAKYFDSLPVRCPSYLNCPANGYQLCQDYEYMMYCCCAK